MKLVSMVDYVFLCRKDESKDNIRSFWACEKYAKFLKQPLKLEMFVPCDDGEPLEKPDFFSGDYDENGFDDVDKMQYEIDVKQYQKAQEKVLFKNKINLPKNKREFNNWVDYNKIETLEDLLKYNLDLELTENAIKKLI